MFSDEARNVFKYNDGTKDVYADPLDVRRRMMRATNGEMDLILEDYGRKVKDADGKFLPEEYMRKATAEESLATAVREAFRLPPFDPETGLGATDSRALEVFVEFDGWLAKNE